MRRRVDFDKVWLGAGLTLFGALGCTSKAPAVTCTCSYGGADQQLQFPATSDPYRVKAVDIAGRFRLKAVYVREPWRAAHVNVYAYHQAEAGDVLLQEGNYLPPFSGTSGRYGFTGRQLVYSPTQRELEYWCQLSP